MDLDTSGWAHVGDSVNSRYFVVEPGVLAAVPRVGAKDDAVSALENQRFQNDHWRKLGRGGVVIVFADNLVEQDKGARRVYQNEPDLALMRGTAILGGTMLGRAIGSFFLGLARPKVPIKLCATLDEALVWARSMNEARDASPAPEGA
jgi:hypothetical protein